MQKLFYPLVTLLFFLYPPEIQCQVIGGNGEGLTSVVTNEDVPYLNEISSIHPIAIRWPGGGDAKLAFPSLEKKGLGLHPDSIQRLYNKFRDPSGKIKQEALDKDLLQFEKELKRSQSALQDLIDLSKKVKNLQVDYCLNVLQGTVESNISAIQTLIDSGVNIVSVVAGNETYYVYHYNFEEYRLDFEPILQACEKQFPDIERFICIGQEFLRKDHIRWNNAAFEYIKSTGNLISGVDVHYYLMEELKEANRMHPGTVDYDPDSTYIHLEDAFQKYIELTNADKGLELLVDYLHKNLPGKKYHCTEFGDKDPEHWSNTIANGGRIFLTFCKHRNDFDLLLVHNFIANWHWAARRPTSKFDLNPEGYTKINRIHWYSIWLANEMPYESQPLNPTISIDKPGEYYYYYNNAGADEWTPEFKFTDVQLTTFEIHFVIGRHTYSSAGQTGFMGKNSVPSMEVDGIRVIQSRTTLSVPRNSFGYVRVVVE